MNAMCHFIMTVLTCHADGPQTCSPTQPCGWTGGGGGFSMTNYSAPASTATPNTSTSHTHLNTDASTRVNSTPAFQSAAVQAYLSKAPKARCMRGAAGTYNAGGRAYPDLAALAAFGIPVCDYGGCSGSGGTSAAAPTIAGSYMATSCTAIRAALVIKTARAAFRWTHS